MEENNPQRRRRKHNKSGLSRFGDGIRNGSEQIKKRTANGEGSGHGENERRRRSDRALRNYIIRTALLVIICSAAMFMGIFAIYVATCIIPNADIGVEGLTTSQSSVIYYQDANDEWQELETLHGGENRIWSDYDELPKYLESAAVSIEDKRFYKHHGVDWGRTFSATVNMFIGMKDTYGGSTITQQTIKNLTGNKEGTVKRKVLEIFSALEFEKTHTKPEIIELYLNNIYLGENCYGVTTAAQAYFGKDVSELDLAECACLIGITNNPSLYDPYISDKSRERNKERQETILSAMLDQKYITQEEYDQAVNETLVFKSVETDDTSSVYSYFVDQVITDVINGLMEQNGVTKQVATQQIYYGGLKIYSTIKPDVQACVDEVYNDASNLDYHSNDGRNQHMQSAITIVDPSTGNIVALAGGIGEKTGSRVLERAVSLRQCGSAIKPIGVYAPSIDAGVITPASVIDDSPVRMINDSPWPKNSEGYYGGLTTVDYAIYESVNTCAVRVVEMLGLNNSFNFLQDKMGITSLVTGTTSDLNSASLGLGGLTDGVSTVEMAAAYATFANEGMYNTPRTYTLVTDSDDKTVIENDSKSWVAMKESTAYIMNGFLQEVITKGTGGSASFPGMTIAGKTGTTSDNRDRYFVGYSPYYCAAVWTGYDIPAKLNVSGNPSAVLWRKVMSKIHADLPNKQFSTAGSEDLVSINVCADSGLLATDLCAEDVRGSRVRTVQVVKGTEPTAYCSMHVQVNWCTEGNALAGEYCPKDSVEMKTVLDYTRESIGGVTCKDTPYLLSTLEASGTCKVHTAATVVPPDTGGDTGIDTGGDTGGDTSGDTGVDTGGDAGGDTSGGTGGGAAANNRGITVNGKRITG